MIVRALLIWVGLAVAMSANGAARDLLYAPYTSELGAHAISSILGIAIILAIARAFVSAHPEAPHRLWVRIGLLWGMLTLIFEIGLGLFVSRLSWSQVLSSYNLFAGRLWPLVLLTVFLAPWYWSRRLYGRASADQYFRA